MATNQNYDKVLVQQFPLLPLESLNQNHDEIYDYADSTLHIGI
jgi:hypothetical protein